MEEAKSFVDCGHAEAVFPVNISMLPPSPTAHLTNMLLE
jgi:hypothetical protein